MYQDVLNTTTDGLKSDFAGNAMCGGVLRATMASVMLAALWVANYKIRPSALSTTLSLDILAEIGVLDRRKELRGTTRR